MSVRGIAQHKFKVLNTKGQVLGYVWADDEDDAYEKAGSQYGNKVGTVVTTHMKRTGKPTSERALYKKEFYG